MAIVAVGFFSIDDLVNVWRHQEDGKEHQRQSSFAADIWSSNSGTVVYRPSSLTT